MMAFKGRHKSIVFHYRIEKPLAEFIKDFTYVTYKTIFKDVNIVFIFNLYRKFCEIKRSKSQILTEVSFQD